MPSLCESSSVGRAPFLRFSPLLSLLLLLLSSYSVQGASLREHRLRGSEPDGQRGGPRQTPNADMLKALEYMEDLRQQSAMNPRDQQMALTPGRSADTEKLGAVLRQAVTAQNKAQAGQGEGNEEDERGEEGEEEDKSQEWLQAVLRTLEETEKGGGPPPHPPPPAADIEGPLPWGQRTPSGTPHKRLPLMFEDDEEDDDGGEGREKGQEEEEEEEEGIEEGDGPFKRTSEDLEGKYTPQNLAALQSVFQDLGRLANAQASHRRQAGRHDDDNGEEDDKDGHQEEVEEDEGDGGEVFGAREPDYEDPAGTRADWGPPQEEDGGEEEEQEEEEEGRTRGLPYGQGEEDEGDDEDRYPVKRSASSGPGDTPDDMANLVDYYLLKVLEKTEEEEHKRELEEEEEEEEEEEDKRRAERRVHPSHYYRDNSDPQQAIYQLIQISQKLQIPPEDLMDMLKTGEMAPRGTALTRGQLQPRKSSQFSKHGAPEADLLRRRVPARQSASATPEDLTTEEILRTLGLDSAPPTRQKQHKSVQSQLRTQPQRQRDYSLPQRRIPGNLKSDYDDAAGHDDLAAYLAAQILSRYPEVAYDKAGQKRAAHRSNRQPHLGSLEQMLLYFNQLDSGESPNQKRQEGAAQTQSWDNEELMKIMGYLTPESEEHDDNADAKPAKGM